MAVSLFGRTFEPRETARRLRLRASANLYGLARFVAAGDAPDNPPDIPQASVHDGGVRSLEFRPWRQHFVSRLKGHGLEIGPLHRPMELHDGATVDYIDRCTVADLRAHYPELNDLPLVEPDVIGDAETMAGVPDGRYDFVIASHVIEHMRNPIGSIATWCRVVKPGGLIYLVAPDKRTIFDRHRVRTTLEHLVLDYRQPSRERDHEHFLDYAVHVDGKAGNEGLAHAEKLAASDYSIHFHVYMPSDIVRLLEWFAANVRPVEVVEGPSMEPAGDEFHVLVRVTP
jgi:hypothetical protein